MVPKELPPFIKDAGKSVKSSIITEEEEEENLSSETDITLEPAEIHSPSISERRNVSPVPAISTDTRSQNTNPFTPPSSAHEESTHRSTTTNPFLMNSPEEEITTKSSASSEENTSEKRSSQHTHHSWLPEFPSLHLTGSRKSEPEKVRKHSILPNPFKALTKHASIQEPKERPALFSGSKQLLKRTSTARRNALHGAFKK